MTDDQALADVAQMPNVRKLLAAQGTTFADAVDSYPLCCPARATFITGQYAHNHGVRGNFFPYGWYGMADRGNILPRVAAEGRLQHRDDRQVAQRLRRARRPRRGPDGLRHLARAARRLGLRLLQLRHELRRRTCDLGRRRLRPQARASSPRSRSPSARTPASPTSSSSSRRSWGPRPTPTGAPRRPPTTRPTSPAGSPRTSSRAQRRAKKPFFIWWSPAAPHREDVATTLMGRPGRDPRPAPRYAAEEQPLHAARGRRASTRPTSATSRRTCATGARRSATPRSPSCSSTTRAAIGSLLAVDDHVKRLVADPASATHQLKNTLIVFLSDNGWLQGEHRIPGDKYLPYEESLRVPFILRGPGIPAGRTVHGQVANIDFAPTLARPRRRPRRAQAGRRLAAAHDPPPEQAAGPGDRARGAAAAAVRRATFGSLNALGPALHRACAPTATPTSSTARRATRSSTTARRDPHELAQRRRQPGLRRGRAPPRRQARGSCDACKGRGCIVRAVSTARAAAALAAGAALALAPGAAGAVHKGSAACTTRATARSSSSRARRPTRGWSSGTRSASTAARPAVERVRRPVARPGAAVTRSWCSTGRGTS